MDWHMIIINRLNEKERKFAKKASNQALTERQPNQHNLECLLALQKRNEDARRSTRACFNQKLRDDTKFANIVATLTLMTIVILTAPARFAVPTTLTIDSLRRLIDRNAFHTNDSPKHTAYRPEGNGLTSSQDG